MHPAPSVILFTVLSGAGFGLLALLGAGLVPWALVHPLWGWGLGYALAVGGLMSSTFHLGHPERAWRALSQWRSSWLSREGVASVATLLLLAPVAGGAVLGVAVPFWLGLFGSLGALVTLGTTAMIYAQLKTVPRWHHPVTVALFYAHALAGGLILSGRVWPAVLALAVLAGVLVAGWAIGDTRFAAFGQTMGTATGLGARGTLRVFERGHTAGNYLLAEMIHVVGRRHSARLRAIALIAGAALPALVLVAGQGHWAAALLAAALHLIGALAQRWLFFAEAEHVVGLYYGATGGRAVP